MACLDNFSAQLNMTTLHVYNPRWLLSPSSIRIQESGMDLRIVWARVLTVVSNPGSMSGNMLKAAANLPGRQSAGIRIPPA